MKVRRAGALAFSLLLAFGAGCRAGALVIGEAETADGDAGVRTPDGGDVDGAPTFTDVDAGDGGEGDCTSSGGSCVPSTSVCVRSSAASCGSGALRCCLPECPIFQNPPNPCDGGPTARLFSKIGCEIGLACAPVDCATAGGTCGALTACPVDRRPDADVYSCGGPPTANNSCCLP